MEEKHEKDVTAIAERILALRKAFRKDVYVTMLVTQDEIIVVSCIDKLRARMDEPIEDDAVIKPVKPVCERHNEARLDIIRYIG